VQVDPIKPKLKLPGTNRLKLQCDEPLSNIALNINLRRYDEDDDDEDAPRKKPRKNAANKAGAYTRPPVSLT